uniref:Transcription factor domain-containing protein n=1 Tax=Psilocybe cubensis TaxID=181762 RepID=A0A8H7XZE5_PSICU
MQQAYIQNLEDKVRKLEGYIEKLHPGKNVYRVIALSEAQEGSNTSIINRSEVPKPVRSLYGITDPNFTLQQTIASSVPSRCVSLAVDGGEMSEEEDLDQIGLSDHLAKLSTNAVEERFFGQSRFATFDIKSLAWKKSKVPNINESVVTLTGTSDRFDVEYPIECDDEYWETDDPEQAFRQPEGKPCTITAFVCFIKLVEILGFALRTLYTNKKSKIISGFIGSDWEGRMVAELDSAMNKWKESLPDHCAYTSPLWISYLSAQRLVVKWEPERQDLLFFHQSVDLHVTYNYVQIQIHRPYLTRPCCLTFSSLAMCTTAARSTAHILEAATTRGIRIFPMTITGAFTSGLVILVGLWGGQSIGYVGDPERDMQTLAKCLNVLKECEKRWIWAGRLRDIINETGALNEYYPTKGDKRSYEASEAASSNQIPATVPSAIDGLINTAFTSLTEIDENPGMMATPEFDWDRLLLSEMGYLPDFPRDNTETLNPATSHRAYNSQGPTPSGIEVPHSQITPGNSIHSSWDNLPSSSFRVEEWDAYLRSMGPS